MESRAYFGALQLNRHCAALLGREERNLERQRRSMYNRVWREKELLMDDYIHINVRTPSPQRMLATSTSSAASDRNGFQRADSSSSGGGRKGPQRATSTSSSSAERHGLERATSSSSGGRKGPQRATSTSSSSAERHGLERATSAVERHGLQRATSSSTERNGLERVTSAVERHGLQRATSSSTERNGLERVTSAVERHGLQRATSSSTEQKCPHVASPSVNSNANGTERATSFSEQNGPERATSSSERIGFQRATLSSERNGFQRAKTSSDRNCLQRATSSSERNSLERATSSSEQLDPKRETSSSEHCCTQVEASPIDPETTLLPINTPHKPTHDRHGQTSSPAFAAENQEPHPAAETDPPHTPSCLGVISEEQKSAKLHSTSDSSGFYTTAPDPPEEESGQKNVTHRRQSMKVGSGGGTAYESAERHAETGCPGSSGPNAITRRRPSTTKAKYGVAVQRRASASALSLYGGNPGNDPTGGGNPPRRQSADHAAASRGTLTHSSPRSDPARRHPHSTPRSPSTEAESSATAQRRSSSESMSSRAERLRSSSVPSLTRSATPPSVSSPAPRGQRSPPIVNSPRPTIKVLVGKGSNPRSYSTPGYHRKMSLVGEATSGYTREQSSAGETTPGYNRKMSLSGDAAPGYNRKMSLAGETAPGYNRKLSLSGESALGYNRKLSSDGETIPGYHRKFSSAGYAAPGYHRQMPSAGEASPGYRRKLSSAGHGAELNVDRQQDPASSLYMCGTDEVHSIVVRNAHYDSDMHRESTSYNNQDRFVEEDDFEQDVASRQRYVTNSYGTQRKSQLAERRNHDPNRTQTSRISPDEDDQHTGIATRYEIKQLGPQPRRQDQHSVAELKRDEGQETSSSPTRHQQARKNHNQDHPHEESEDPLDKHDTSRRQRTKSNSSSDRDNDEFPEPSQTTKGHHHHRKGAAVRQMTLDPKLMLPLSAKRYQCKKQATIIPVIAVYGRQATMYPNAEAKVGRVVTLDRRACGWMERATSILSSLEKIHSHPHPAPLPPAAAVRPWTSQLDTGEAAAASTALTAEEAVLQDALRIATRAQSSGDPDYRVSTASSGGKPSTMTAGSPQPTVVATSGDYDDYDDDDDDDDSDDDGVVLVPQTIYTDPKPLTAKHKPPQPQTSQRNGLMLQQQRVGLLGGAGVGRGSFGGRGRGRGIGRGTVSLQQRQRKEGLRGAPFVNLAHRPDLKAAPIHLASRRIQ